MDQRSLEVVRQQLVVVARRNSHTSGASAVPTRPAQRVIEPELQRVGGRRGRFEPELALLGEHPLRVGDVVHLHGELADPVGGGERGRAPLHAQPLRVVGDAVAARVEDRVVVAAAQLDRHLAGDDRGDERLQRVAQHQRLQVEPAALVEQPAEPAALLGVGLERRLVVDRGQQPLVGDVEERHPGRLVDAAALRLDDPVLDLVGHPEPVTAADGVRFHHELDRVGALELADRDRQAVSEADRDRLGLDLDRRDPSGGRP